MRIPIEVGDGRSPSGKSRSRYPGFHRSDPWEDSYRFPTDRSSVTDYDPERAASEHDAHERSLLREAEESGPREKNLKGNNDRLVRTLPTSANEATFPSQRTEDTEETWKHRYLRLLADFENHKRKTKQEGMHQVGIGKDAVLDDILPILDHMENAIQAAREAGESNGILEGLELVHQAFLKALQKHGVEKIEAVGKPFDPKVHEAMAVTEHDTVPEDTVVQEVRTGFLRGKKLLRPARVIVAQ